MKVVSLPTSVLANIQRIVNRICKLILQPFVLTELKLILQVKIKGTVLSTGSKKRITVVKSHLVAVIAGGTTKVVGQTTKEISMDASSSHDPDDPDEDEELG